MAEKSRFVESLKNVRQEMKDALKQVGWDREKGLQKARELEAEQKRHRYPCPDCDGEGDVPSGSWSVVGDGEPYEIQSTCKTCNGTGIDPEEDI